MKEKIEFLYANRHRFDGYMRVWICKIHAWMRIKIENHTPYWEQSLAHNSILLIERAWRGLNRQKSRSGHTEISPAELDRIRNSEIFKRGK